MVNPLTSTPQIHVSKISMTVREANLRKESCQLERERQGRGRVQKKSALVSEIFLQVVKLSGQQHLNHPRGKNFDNLQSLLSLPFGKQAALAAPISACTDIISLAINDSQR